MFNAVAPMGRHKIKKTMEKEKQVLFEKWYNTFRTRSSYVKKTFGEFTVSEKEDCLISNYPDLVPSASTKIDAVTKLTATTNVAFDIIAKLARLNGKQDNEVFAWWADCIKNETTFDYNVLVEWGKASQKARVAYLQKVSGISESKEVLIPVLGGINFAEFIQYAYNKMTESNAQNEENKATEATEATEAEESKEATEAK